MINEVQVLEIYHSTETPKQLSVLYNVTTSFILGIKKKIYHKSITKDLNVLPGAPLSGYVALNEDIVKKIFLEVGSYSYFLKTYGVSWKRVKSIKSKYTYKSITKDLGVAGSVKKYKLTNQDTVDIYNSNLSLDELSLRYKINSETVRNIKNVHTRRFFKDEY